MELSFKVRFGSFSTFGGRAYQEDRLVALSNINGKSEHYFAVFDGHGGSLVSDHLSKNFHSSLLNHSKIKGQPINALQECWASFDEECYKACQIEEKKDQSKSFPQDGSTGTVCYIINDDIYITNCGDSGAYSVMADGITATLLTEDHGTLNSSEVQRCEKAGGKLKTDTFYKWGPFPMCCVSTKIVGKPRIYPGGLLVTRAFGDFHAKVEYLGGFKGVVVHDHGRIRFLKINSNPPSPTTASSVKDIDNNTGSDPPSAAIARTGDSTRIQYLILASDGVWDGLGIEEVLQILRDDDVTNSQQQSGAAVANNVKHSPKSVPLTAVIPVTQSNSATNSNDEILNEVKPLIASGNINADISAMDSRLTRIAKNICIAAVKSKKWTEYGSSADNTSCTIIEIVHSI